MDKKVNELRVALVGGYPPPYGGVSIHIQRLHTQCLSNNIRCTVFDISRHVKKVRHVVNVVRPTNWWYILTSRQNIIHVHTTSTHWKINALFFVRARIKGARFIISYHSFRYSAKDFSPLGRSMVRMMLSSASHCIADSSEIKAKLISMGARAERVSVIPAFLPPAKNEQEATGIPEAVRDFIDSHSPVISAGAFRMVLYDGQDRYGINMCVELCASLKSTYPRIGFVFCLPDIGDQEYFARMKQEIRDKNIEDNFLFVTDPLNEAYPVWKKSDIFVRPTTSDADSISLREALYFKTPSVASDAALRPEGTVLFRSCNIEDFTARVKMVLDNHGYYKSKTEALEMGNGLDEIFMIYRSLANK